MRHRNNRIKLNRTASHRRCLFANMLKALILHGKITTTVPKAKFLKRYADRMVTLAKRNSLAARRRAAAQLMLRYNSLTSKESRAVKKGDLTHYNDDRKVLKKLFDEIGPRFTSRNGGYTRVTKNTRRQGDNAPTCFIEYLAE
jgi:large subunit ribosomal protein L17